MIISNYSASNCTANRHSLFIGPDGELAASHSTVIKRGVILAVIGERPAKERGEKVLRLGEIARRNPDIIDPLLSDRCIRLIFELFRE